MNNRTVLNLLVLLLVGFVIGAALFLMFVCPCRTCFRSAPPIPQVEPSTTPPPSDVAQQQEPEAVAPATTGAAAAATEAAAPPSRWMRAETNAVGAVVTLSETGAQRVGWRMVTGAVARLPLLDLVNLKLTRQAAEALALTPEEQARIEAALAEARARIQEQELASMSVTNASGGLQSQVTVLTSDSRAAGISSNLGTIVLTVAPFPEAGRQIRDDLYTALNATLGADRARRFRELGESQLAMALANFGERERRITLSVQSNAAGGMLYQLHEVSENTMRMHMGAFRDASSLPAGYRHLFEDSP